MGLFMKLADCWRVGVFSRGEVLGMFAAHVCTAVDYFPEDIKADVINATIDLLTAKRDGTPTFTVGG